MKTQTAKTIVTTIIIVMALFQGPFSYYSEGGFIKMILVSPFALLGLLLTIFLLSSVLTHKSSNTKYHVIGLTLAILIGVITLFENPVEYLDFKLRLTERNKIIEKFKNGELKSDHLPEKYILPISNSGNDVDIQENHNGIASIGFYIDRGFLDHYSEFLYTNNPAEIKLLDDKIKSNEKMKHVKKLEDNWYILGY